MPQSAWDPSLGSLGFCAGTRIVTLDGEAPVEQLAPGTLVLTLSGAGAPLKPVLRTGQAHLDLAAHADPGQVCPVRIAAGAIEAGVPIRDLRVSPDHGIALEDAAGRRGLVPAGLLVNGATVRRDAALGTVTYVQVAIGTHELLMADGMVAESGRGSPGASPPDAQPHLAAAAVREIHARLLERAGACGHRLTDDPGLAVLCAGRLVDRIMGEAGEYAFLLPPGSSVVVLRSRLFVPAETDPAGGDGRCLGVAVDRIVHDGVDLDIVGPACGAGFLPPEGDGPHRWRWTTGEAMLALPVLAQETVLELRLRRGWGRYWLPPRG